MRRKSPTACFVLFVTLYVLGQTAAFASQSPSECSSTGSECSVSPFPVSGAYSLLSDSVPPSRNISSDLKPEERYEQHNTWKNSAATDTAFSLDFPKMLAIDTYHVLSSPLRWDGRDWLTFSAVTMGITALALTDRPVKEEFRRLYERNDDELAQQIRRFGGPYSFITIGLFYAGGAVFQAPKPKAVALDATAATLLASGIMVPFLKLAVGRDRPNADNGTYAFRPFSGERSSFPSGESAQAFAVASVIAAHYDQLWIQGTSYGIASLVAIARLYLDGHFLSDVAAGAVIGTVVGRTIVSYNQEARSLKQKKRNVSIVPFFSRTGGGLRLTVS
jgi:membrane-associated phospholipid phosphatase